MSGSLQNKLQQFEVIPPPAVWDKISQQLNDEFVTTDANVSSKLDDASITAPAGMWDKIAQGISENDQPQAKTFSLIYRRIAIAALIIGLLVTGGLYYFNRNVPGNAIVNIVPEKKETQAIVEERPKPRDSNNPAMLAQNESVIKKYKKKSSQQTVKSEDDNYVVDEQPAFTEYNSNPEQAHIYDLQTVSALQPVSVSAPPLRDKKGNIILDASLISKPEDEYITVTGPNGKQTRISNKFLSCLGYINAGFISNDMDSRGIRCKAQFEEWRMKILAQPAFIPTANNFFDIFELKDLIQEM